MAQIPDCAVPVPESFKVEKASTTNDMKGVIVTFDHPVDPNMAIVASNYEIKPTDVVVITSADVNPHEPECVRVGAEGLKPDTNYTLTVNNVVSSKGTSFGPQRQIGGVPD